MSNLSHSSKLQPNFACDHVEPHSIFTYGLIMLLGYCIKFLQQPITVLVMICLLHFGQGSHNAVTKHVILIKPHSPESIQETH